MQLIELAHTLKGIMKTRQRALAIVPHGGHRNESNVGRLGLLPRLDQGVDRIAMRTGVPEEFQHLNLAGRNRCGLRWYKPSVVDAFSPRAGSDGRGGCGSLRDKALMVQSLPPRLPAERCAERVAAANGFSLHAGVAAEQHQREKIERL